jgi:hypothetical protein
VEEGTVNAITCPDCGEGTVGRSNPCSVCGLSLAALTDAHAFLGRLTKDRRSGAFIHKLAELVARRRVQLGRLLDG